MSLMESLAAFRIATGGVLSSSPLTSESDSIVESWGRPGGDYWYALVEDSSVDKTVWAAAHTGRGFAAAHLNMSAPAMRFYVPASGTEEAYRDAFPALDQNGHADRGTRSIGVRADIGPRLAAEVAAHETLHLLQDGVDRDADEAEALAYGRWVAGVVIGLDGTLAGRVHNHTGPMFKALQAAGEHGDIMVARDEGGTRVLRNTGSGGSVRWRDHHAVCPLELDA